MEWNSGKISRTSYFNPNIALYRVNDTIYDEIVYRDGQYYLIRRCATEKYRDNHTHEIFYTDGITLVYPLPENVIQEQPIEVEGTLRTFSEQTVFTFKNRNCSTANFTFNVDKRFKESTNVISGNSILISTDRFDSNRTSYIYKIKNSAADTISVITISVNENPTTIQLPCELKQGDELLYDLDYKEWIYYPDSDDEDVLYYSDFAAIIIDEGVTEISCPDNIVLTVGVSYIDVRELTQVINISLENQPYDGEYGFGRISWDEVQGASEYEIYMDDVYVSSVDNNISGVMEYNFHDEQDGSLTIIAKNDLTASEMSEPLQVQTVPNTVTLGSIDTMFDNNRYYISVKFLANSRTADYYNIIYNIDDSQEITVQLEHDKQFNKENVYEFTVPIINDRFVVKLTAENFIGVNDYSDAVTLVTNAGIDAWTYKTAMNKMLVTWYDLFGDGDGYSLKYKIDDSVDWELLHVDNNSDPTQRIMEYIDLSPDSEMKVCLALIRDGYTHIYTKPISISKSKDINLIPPKDFVGTKIKDGEIQFNWTDSYDVDSSYELYYTYSDGTSKTIRLSGEASSEGKYTYVYNTDNYGFIQARLRMVWELGESEYSENIIVYNIPTIEEAPLLHHQDRSNKQLKISWDIYDYVSKYVLYFTVDGEQNIIEQVDNVYLWDIPTDKAMYSINIAVKAVFMDGTETNISKSLSFNICNINYDCETMIFTHNEVQNKLDTIIMRKGIEDIYQINTLSMNSFIREFLMTEKTYRPYLFADYKFIENYWGHGIGNSYNFRTDIKNAVQYLTPLKTVFYSKNLIDLPVNTVIYYPVFYTYPLSTEITKVVIACLGEISPHYVVIYNEKCRIKLEL